MRPTIICDIDGVLADWVTPCFRQYSEVYPNDKIAPVTNYNVGLSTPRPEQLIRFIQEYYFMHRTFRDALPYHGAVEGFNKLAFTFPTVIATARLKEHSVVCFEWLFRHEFKFYRSLLFEKDKHKVEGDILIDDCTENLQKFADTGRQAICMDRSWNQDWPGMRVKDMVEAFEWVKNYQYELNLAC